MVIDHSDYSKGETLSSDFRYRWFLAALLFFLVAGLFAVIMRYFFLREIPFLDYRHVLHAHSHLALLGWGFMLASGSLLFLVLRQVQSQKPYIRIFWLNMISCAGMGIAFLLQGYGAFSIFFSALHILTAYLFAVPFLRDLAKQPPMPSTRFARWGIYWMLLSTTGIWAVAPVIILLGKGNALFYMAVQFFLHFQFNGWFTYIVLAVLIHFLHERGNAVRISNRTFYLLQASVVLTYALSITWSTPLSVIFYLNSLGVVLQAIAFYLLLKELFRDYHPFRQLSHLTDWLLLLGIGCLLGKVLVHLAVAVPAIAQVSYTIRNYVIGFIHLIMLGAVTFTLAAILTRKSLLPWNAMIKSGWLLLGAGFMLKEALLFGQGTLLWMKEGFLPGYYEMVFGITAVLPAGLLLIVIGYLNAKPHFARVSIINR